MAIYRADRKHGVAWVTGGSTGIGRQLAADLAREGWTVAVTARMEHPEHPMPDVSGIRGGKIAIYNCDVTDETGMAETIRAIEHDLGPITLAVFNAGVYIPIHGEALSIADFRATYEVNLFGVLNGMVPLIERMRGRNRGHIMINASISSYFGWPTLAAYGATKAALNNMAQALRYDLDKMNIRIQVVNPGFVRTPLSAKNAYLMPAPISVEKASACMMRAIRSGGFETTFPRWLTWWVKFMRLWPHELCFRFMNSVTRWRSFPLVPGRKRK